MANVLGLVFASLFVSSSFAIDLQQGLGNSSQVTSGASWDTSSVYSLSSSLIPKEECPPCFNCLLPRFKCGNYGVCNEYDGQCRCPEGWSGNDCLTPQCGSLADGSKRRPRPPNKECECDEGWGGINCNVCQTDDACSNFPIAGMEHLMQATDQSDAPVKNMTCYKGGVNVRNQHQMCNVTNKNIVDALPGRPPQVTFSCNAANETCAFQFWIGKVESFYCGLEKCTSDIEYGYNKNTTFANCEKIKCSCIPGRMLCGEAGSVNIDDFLDQEIKGPAKFSCKSESNGSNGSKGSSCRFEEPAMNELINDVFGDQYITLDCFGGECLHYTQVPGYVAPPKPDYTIWVALSCAGAAAVFLCAVGLFWYAGRTNISEGFSGIRLPEEEAARLMTEHVPAQLHFSDISYTIPSGKTVLSGVSGTVKSGQIMAIMGPSGAGKSTLLDILARRLKRGTVQGNTLVNGRNVNDSEFKKVVGFVDQEDLLMSTLTVYETVLYSALLRLPREMSLEAKKFRTLETMHELGILGIKDSRIGDSGKRSISGGEKRRVSIACELVTSPSILFLDEPTSGLDAYNAYNVVESLVTLARDYNRTVVFTIHQPRSNIVALFDQLVLLAKGQVIYSGPFAKCQSYFQSIGFACPPGFNIADYLIDLTMTASSEVLGSESATRPASSNHSTHEVPTGDQEHAIRHSDNHLVVPGSTSSPSSADQDDVELRARRKTLLAQSADFFKRAFGETANGSSTAAQKAPQEVHLETLVKAYAESDVSKGVRQEIDALKTSNTVDSADQTRDVAEESNMLRGRRRASWLTQFRILSGRAFKNLYRNPLLLTAHYAAAIAIALICGLLIHHVHNDISGFQNRLGFFFFTLALFGFSCLSSITLFANERILFMRERANGYYSSGTYFTSKVLFDVVPLRVVPALVYGSIVYGLVGLVPTLAGFWKFLLALVLFNLTAASVILFVSIAIAETAVAGLVGTLIMLQNLLFAGLLVNRDTISPWLDWLHVLSFFHAAYEAMAVNELRYLQLKEVKFGVELDVAAAAILSTFGFRASAYWWPDIATLAIMCTVFLIVSWIWLHFFVKEKR
ncbi:ABC transporter G family member ARB_01379 {ECO:0000305} Short=ABC transporter ARB_01379 {ECO:0000305}; Flags: Precursor [Serendipita indica DSM 11827]|nr:ABC transporter G family member ARB_01379 {ECO:0000305} Short=ABC transporter ARB_01379 {ECO:0000305}; Flags: Precursor [Serendipita indica DSM 11827]